MRSLAFLLFACVPGAALGQCANGQCSAPPSFGVPVSPVLSASSGNTTFGRAFGKIEWKSPANLNDESALYLDGTQVGSLKLVNTLDGIRGFWQPLSGNTWGERKAIVGRDDPKARVESKDKASAKGQCPGGVCIGECKCKECKCVAKPPVIDERMVEQKVPNFGLDWQPRDYEEKWTASGEEVSEATARRVMGRRHKVGEDLIDDSQLIDLTLIGTAPDRKRVLDDLASDADLANFRGKLNVHTYAPDSWIVKDYGFKTDGSPTIYVQKPTGEVLHRSDLYAGPKMLAAVLRKTDPNYDPNKDPDLTKPKPEPKPDPKPDVKPEPIPVPPKPLDPTPVPKPVDPQPAPAPKFPIHQNWLWAGIAGLAILILKKGK